MNELRAQRAATLQHDFPLGDLWSAVVSINRLLNVSGPGTRNAPSTGIRVPDPTPASEEQPRLKDGGDGGCTKDNAAKTDGN